jgi:hypothetical protein
MDAPNSHLIARGSKTQPLWLELWNTSPKPFVWKKPPFEILDSLAQHRQ